MPRYLSFGLSPPKLLKGVKEGPIPPLSFHEFLFKAFCSGLSIKVDPEWTPRGPGLDPDRAAVSGSVSGSVSVTKEFARPYW